MIFLQRRDNGNCCLSYRGDGRGQKQIAVENIRLIGDRLPKRFAEGHAQFGSDVEIAPKKTYVSLRRTKQFAIVQAATKTRVDLGLNLKTVDPTERLEGGNVFSGMCTHRVRLAFAKDVDGEVISWLKQAYDQA